MGSPLYISRFFPTVEEHTSTCTFHLSFGKLHPQKPPRGFNVVVATMAANNHEEFNSMTLSNWFEELNRAVALV
jgi:hypothetical protein